jgi:hypothetical protein
MNLEFFTRAIMLFLSVLITSTAFCSPKVEINVFEVSSELIKNDSELYRGAIHDALPDLSANDDTTPNMRLVRSLKKEAPTSNQIFYRETIDEPFVETFTETSGGILLKINNTMFSGICFNYYLTDDGSLRFSTSAYDSESCESKSEGEVFFINEYEYGHSDFVILSSDNSICQNTQASSMAALSDVGHRSAPPRLCRKIYEIKLLDPSDRV